jgi:hypothetical protein
MVGWTQHNLSCDSSGGRFSMPATVAALASINPYYARLEQNERVLSLARQPLFVVTNIY